MATESVGRSLVDQRVQGGLDHVQLARLSHRPGCVDHEGQRRVRPVASRVGPGGQPDAQQPDVTGRLRLVAARQPYPVEVDGEAIPVGLRVVLLDRVDELLGPDGSRIRQLAIVDERPRVRVGRGVHIEREGRLRILPRVDLGGEVTLVAGPGGLRRIRYLRPRPARLPQRSAVGGRRRSR